MPIHARFPSASAAILFIVVSADPVMALDWPEFRGPTGQGLVPATSTALPIFWNTSSNVAWKQAIPGEGWSSPTLKEGKIYLTSAVTNGLGKDQYSLRVLCLDADTGKTIWNNEVFAPEPKKIARGHAKNSQASATPLIAGDRLYAHFGHLGTACLKFDGTTVWKNERLNYPPVHGNGGSPILVNDLLIFNCDGGSNPFIVGLNAATGQEVWRTRRITTAKKTFSFCTPIVIEVNGKSQIISPGSGMVCALDPKNGEELWRVRYGEGYSVVPRPVYSRKHNLIYLSSGFDRPILMAIRPDGHGDVTDTHVAWQVSKSAPNTPSPLLVNDEIYVVADSGVASCIDAASGKVYWQERVGGNYSASPLFAGGRVYFQNEEGTCVVVKASRQFEKIAENALGERTLASFAATDDAFYIRSEQSLFKISAD